MPPFNYLQPGPVVGINSSGGVQSGTLAAQSVTSGVVGSGAVTGQAGGGYFTIASGTITTNDIGSGAIVSGLIASGQVGSFHIASGRLTGFELGSGAIVSGRIASGQVGNRHIGSGSIDTNHLTDATVANTARRTAPLQSGSVMLVVANEMISGFRAVALDVSGQLVIAMAGVSGRMPAIGVVFDDTLSGSKANTYTGGLLALGSGIADWSGFIGKRLWVGRSGQIVSLSGSWGSGGFLSGDLGQPIGTALFTASGACSGAALINVFPTMWSGGPLGIAVGGPY